MAINPALLVGAPVLQNYLVDDATGEPLINGTVTFYQDNSRTTLKNVYYQTGSPGDYSYTTLPNPLTTSSAGTIVDANGNDVLPLYYPYSETDNSTPQTYYITCFNEDGQSQWTRQNFPPGSGENTVETSVTFNNLIQNNVFWRNQGSVTTSSLSTAVICPSQHDGFVSNIPSSLGSYPSTPTLCGPDIIYIRNDNSGTETLSFNKFISTNTTLVGDPTPEYFINLNNTSAGVETYKYISIPICLHVNNLSGYSNNSVTIQAMNVSGASNTLTLSLFQYLGAGATQTTPGVIQTIDLSNSWTKYTYQFSFPTSNGLTLGGGGDDGWFLQIGFPAGETCNISVALPSVYLSSTVPTNSFQTYEDASAIIDSPRTGDVRISSNSYYPYGWVPCNNGTIGNASSGCTARANADTWPLFNLLWNNFSFLNPSGNNPICPMFNSSGTPVSYGSSAIADFNANNQLGLLQILGQVLLGTAPLPMSSGLLDDNFTVSNDGNGNLLVTLSGSSYNINLYYQGQPVYITASSGATLPGNLALGTIYYVSYVASSSTLYLATSYANALSSTYIAYSSTGTGTFHINPGLSGSFTGQYAHTLLSEELPNPLTSGAHIASVGSTGTNVIGSSASSGTGIISNAGGGYGHNTVQPSICMNIFLKL